LNQTNHICAVNQNLQTILVLYYVEWFDALAKVVITCHSHFLVLIV